MSEELPPWERLPAEKEPSTLEKIAKVLDYPGGVVRGGIARLAAPKTLSAEEYKAALMGQKPFPSSAELMERGGTPSGGYEYLLKSGAGVPLYALAKNFPSIAKYIPEQRAATGFALDVAADPTNLLTAGAGRIAKSMPALAKWLRPVEAASEAGGKALYKSGMKQIDRAGAEFGKIPASDILLREGVWGKASTIEKKMAELATKLTQLRTSKYFDPAAAKGAEVDMTKALAEAEGFLNQLKASKDPAVAAYLPEMEKVLDEYKSIATGRQGFDPVMGTVWKEGQTVTPEAASTMKTSIYKEKLSPSDYSKLGTTDAGEQFYKKLARGLGTESEQAVGRVMPGAAPEVERLNQEIGALLTPRQKAAIEARKEVTRNMVTPVDTTLIAADPTHTLPILKKLGDISKATPFRTGAGLGLHSLGTQSQGLADIAARRALLNQILGVQQSQTEEKPPWE